MNFMSNLTAIKIKDSEVSDPALDLGWKVSPPVKALLDVIANVMAEEYMSVAKQNSNIFAIREVPHDSSDIC
ncbi:MAG: hypothetical protein ABR913_04920 [Sedimentisphaerales bacterium]|jgi:hypothetical protein